MDNSCEKFDILKKKYVLGWDFGCETFNKGQMKIGFNYVLTSYVNSLLTSIKKIKFYTEHPDISWQGSTNCPRFPKISNLQNNLVCMMMTEETAQMSKKSSN